MNAYLISACDRAMAEASPSTGAPPAARQRRILATCILASSLAFIDGSVVNVGLPAIGRSLGADGAALTWIVN
ncbi:MAG: Drug resistance transporter EmrB/QacA subfamily, partial [Massilia sp.]|nr:Drug resistance transporter EmrB/QacA subfamily [Massilia sp.]